MDSLIFDLDGTLWDVSHLSAKAWNIGLKRLDIQSKPITREDIAAVTGLPYEEIVGRLLPEADPADFSRLAVELDAVEQEIIPAEGGLLYDGVGEALEKLEHRFPLFLVSNCQAWYLEWFLDWSGFRPLFRDYESYGATGRPKSENIGWSSYETGWPRRCTSATPRATIRPRSRPAWNSFT